MDLILNTWIMLSTTLIILLVLCFNKQFQYWKRRNVPQLEASLWINFKYFFETGKIFENLLVSYRDYYKIAKENKWKHVGVYSHSKPVYFPIDLDYIKNILTKDFEYFTDRGFFYNEKDDPLSAHLFAIGNPKWRSLRTKMTPTFTSGKMKNMFPILAECGNPLLKAVDEKCGSPIDIKEILARYTTDIIGSCAFGLEFNTFQEENSPFRVYGNKIYGPPTPKQIWSRRFCNMFPEVAKYFKITTVPQDIADFFIKLVRDNVEHRDKNEVRRDDFMQLLIQVRDSGDFVGGKVMSVEEMAAQCFVFFIAGFETSSTTMSFALYQIAKNPELQQKLRQEVEEVVKRHEGELTYEASQGMKLLNQVINGGCLIGMYPPVPFLIRKCVKSYKLPNEGFTIDKGTPVFISSHSIQYDEEYYPNPEKFDPSRFSEENKKSRHCYAFLSFGEGPRNCIGARFGLMQTRFGLASLLRKYRFTVDGKTKEPLKLKKGTFILAPEGGIWLNAEKI